MQNWDKTGTRLGNLGSQSLVPVWVWFLALHPGPEPGPGPVPKVHPGTSICGSLLIVINTIHLMIGPVFTGLMSVRLSEELVSVEIGPLYALETSGKRRRFMVYHTEASR
jgi:hypothetical protein